MAIIVLYILLGIIALIVILLHFSVRAEIKASKQGVDIKVKWLFITLYPGKAAKNKKTRNKKDKTNKSEQAQDVSKETADKLVKEAEKTEAETKVEENTKLKDDVIVQQQTVETDCETVKTKRIKQKDKPEKVSEEKTGKKGKLAQLKDKYKAIKPYIPTGWKYFKKLLKKIRFTNIDADVKVGKEDAYEAAVWYGKVQGIIFGTMGWLSSIFTVGLKHIDVHCKFNEKVMDGNVSLKVKVRPSTIIHIAVCLGVNFLRIFLRQRRQRKRRIKELRKRREQKLKKKQL